MKLKVWMAVNGSGEFLCMGNGNKGMSYHFSYPFDSEYLRREDYIICRTKWEVEEHIRKWHGESSPYKPTAGRWRCRPVRMEVSWTPAPPKGRRKNA